MTARPGVRVDRVEALEAEALRLLACAIGEHLPIELALRVDALEAERAKLERPLSPTSGSPAGVA